VEDLDLDAVRRQFEVNVFAYVAWMREVAGLMVSQEGRGRIVNVSSVSGRIAMPGLGAYAASKYAVEAFSDAARRELHPFGIRVVLVEPGSVTSEIWGQGQDLSEALGLDWRGSRYRRLYELEQEHAERMRSGKGPSSDVVAQAVVKAATARRPKARYLVTGEARAGALLAKLPTGLQDWLLRRLMK
jgi:NAD(P)-dependent dehydrogenase (short-subunit alcohol dehydrogenase family)